MPNERDMRQRLAGDELRQLGGGVALAAMVDLFIEPGFQWGKFTAGEHLREAAEVAVGLLEELRRIEVAERISREVTDQCGGPVDVLQAAVGVGLGLDAEVL